MSDSVHLDRAERIGRLRDALNALDDSVFGAYVTDSFDEEMPAPTVRPNRGEHPRVMVNRSMLPEILRYMERDEMAATVAEYRSLRDEETDGRLPPASLHEKGRLGEHNYDYRLLAVIQAKALEYLLSGDALYGYEAILCMENYLLTLDVKWINSDQCREFGYVMYMVACVYDWCYPLLTERDKYRLAAGVEHRLCRGHTEDTVHSTYHGVKMEMGFPPSKMGAISGHGSETQLLRDYLAYSIAVYDEYPALWDFCGGRFYRDFTPPRNIYYRSGMIHQGTSNYAPWRHEADLFSAWIVRTMSGTMPYVPEMAQVVRSFFGHELPDGTFINTGDSRIAYPGQRYSACALLASALFEDGMLRAQAKHLRTHFETFPYGTSTLTPAELLILNGRGVETAEDRHEGMPLVQYNPYPLGQIIARTSWDDPDSPVCFMRLGERTGANHEHGDTGTFQIFYKNSLTGPTGVYRGYGTDHHRFYHQATVAMNGLLFYDAEMADGEEHKGWYSGSQRRIGETGKLSCWLSEQYRKATEIGMATGEDYAYLAGDITNAYPSETVALAQRRMLAVFTKNKKTPLLLFVFDSTAAVKESCRKSFVMHSIGEPTVVGGTVIAPARDAKLTLTPLLGGSVELIGGAGRAYEIGGRNCWPKGLEYDRADVEWGRIEIVKTGAVRDDFLHVITASDIDAEIPAIRGAASAELAVSEALGTAVAFVRSPYRQRSVLTLETSGEEKRYFVSGVCHGKYSVSVDGREVAVAAATEKSGLLVFTAPAGRVRIAPID